MTYGPVTLVVPPGALVAPTTIALSEIPDPPRGAIGPAYDFAPDGLVFALPATLKVFYDRLTLPAGTEPASLRLSVLDRGRWVPLDGHVNRRAERRVVGTVAHFSTYGIVPDPHEVSGRGTRWEANGIAGNASEEMFGRLFVSPTAVSLFLGGEAAGPVTITLSGLPTDEDNRLYVDGYGGGRVIGPADGGVLALALDGTSPHYLWLQPRPGTTIIGGAADQCPSVGVRSGTTCTLTRDIVAGVSIEAGGETLDCAGHRIYQPFADRETGIGVLVGGFGATGPLDDVTIRNCTVGGPDAGFWEGLAVTGTSATRLLDSTFADNMVGAFFAGATNARVTGNRFEGEGNLGIQMYEGSSDGEIADNTIALVPGIDPIGMMFKGMEGKLGPLPTTRMTVERNTIAGGSVGIGLILAEENEISRNDLDGPRWGLWIGQDGRPNRFWWNNVTTTTWGVYADVGPAEVSDGVGEGNWWNHTCPGALFTPGVDSNRSDVEDSYPYGTRNGWDAGERPNCDDAEPASVLCPGDANKGAQEIVWDHYVPRSAVVRAAWERLREEILANEAEHDDQVRAERAEEGLILKETPPLPPIAVWNRDTDNPRTIAGRMTRPTTADAHAVVRQFLNGYGELLGSTVPGATLPELHLAEAVSTTKGTMIAFEQKHRGLPIVGGGLSFFIDPTGALRLVTGHYYPAVDVDLRGACNRAEALDAARARFRSVWPDSGRLQEDASMVLFAAPGERFVPAWKGWLRDRDAPQEWWTDRYAEFEVDAAACEIRKFGEPGGTYVGHWGGLGVMVPATPILPWRFHDLPPLVREIQPALVQETYHDHFLQENDDYQIHSLASYRFRSAPVQLPPTGTCTIPGHPDYVDMPCWLYDPQPSRPDVEAAGCYPANTNPAVCDALYSSIECATAFWRIEDFQNWTYWLEAGVQPSEVAPFDRRLIDLRCNMNGLSTGGEFRRRLLDPNWVLLGPFRTSNYKELEVIDHEYAHHWIYLLVRSHGYTAVGSGAGFDQDSGQSWALDEVLPDVFANARGMPDAGLYYPYLEPGFYPTQDLSRRAGRRLPDRIPCSDPADCGSASLYCFEDDCTPKSMFIAPITPGDQHRTDSYNWVGESGTHDGHTNLNGRVLYQALVDFRERFGSRAFDPAVGIGYAGPRSRACVVTTRGLVCSSREWGVSHELGHSSPGVLRCEAGGGGSQILREYTGLTEDGAGEIALTFKWISLPEGAVLRTYRSTFWGWRSVDTIVGPVEYDASIDGPLYSVFVAGPRIKIEAVRTFGPGEPCDDTPMFGIMGWRHIGGTIAAREIAWGTWQVANGYVDWYDLANKIMAADRTFYDSHQRHQGSFFVDAFDNHGINDELESFCGDSVCQCHDWWYCW